MKALMSNQSRRTRHAGDAGRRRSGCRQGQVVIDVKACSINYPDVLIIQDMYQFKPPRPFAPGGEVSGVDCAVGEGVTDLKVGDRVASTTGHGGLVEKVAVDQNAVFKIPDSVSFEDASALLLTYGTSIHALVDRGHIKEGETLLVLGASGGVGIAAVELGKAFGAALLPRCRPRKRLHLRKRGRRRNGGLSTRALRQGPVQGTGERSSRPLSVPTARTSSMTASAATIANRPCARSPGKAAFWWSASRPALPNCRST